MRRAVVAGCGVYGLWWAVYCNWTFGDALGPEVGAVYRPVAGLLVWALVGPAVCGWLAPGSGWFRVARSAALAVLLMVLPLVGGWIAGQMTWSAWPLLIGAGVMLLVMMLVGPAPVFARVDGIGAWRSVGRAMRRVRGRDVAVHLGALAVLVIGGGLGALGGWGREAWGAGAAPWMWVELVIGCVLVGWLSRRALRRAGVEVAGRVRGVRADRGRMRAAAPVGGVVFALGAAAAIGGAVDGWVVSGAAVLMGLVALAGAGWGAHRRAGVAAGWAGGLALVVVCAGVAVGAGVVEHLAWMVSPELQNFLPWVNMSGVSIHADQLALVLPPVTAPAGVALPVPSFEWVVGHGAIWPERAVARAWAVGVGVVGLPWALLAAGLAAREGLAWRAALSRARVLLADDATAATGVRLLAVSGMVALLGVPRLWPEVFVVAQIGWAAAAGVYAAWVAGVGAALLDRVSASAVSPDSRETDGA